MPVFNILDLPDDQRKTALTAFKTLADGQRNGDPENFGGAGKGNSDIHFATGLFTWLTEHVGDITHRMALPFHVTQLDCGYSMAASKIERCLGDMRRHIEDGIARQIRNNYDYHNMESKMSFNDFMDLIKDAVRRYSEAHAKLPVWNEAQYHARQAAVCLGLFDFKGCEKHLAALASHINSPEDWVAYAGQVTMENGSPVPYKASLNEGDTDETMKPTPMSEPKVLYRAVSIPEMIDIVKKGKIVGGLNKFNDFDRRRHVFFGDHVSKNLIYQGEEIERQVVGSLMNDPIHAQFERLNAELEALKEKRNDLARDLLDEINEERRNPMEWNDSNPPIDWIVRAGQIMKIKSPLYTMVKKISTLHDTLTDLQKKYREKYCSEFPRLKSEIQARRFTSAVIETYPITGGLHYSKQHGFSGMGNEDEYGFPSGAVTASDIHQIFWVKDGQIEMATPYSEATEVLKTL